MPKPIRRSAGRDWRAFWIALADVTCSPWNKAQWPGYGQWYRVVDANGNPPCSELAKMPPFRVNQYLKYADPDYLGTNFQPISLLN